MSYILDALKQSERRRNRQSPVNSSAIPAEASRLSPTSLYRRYLPWILLLLILALPVGYFIGHLGARWLGQPPEQPTPVIPLPAPAISGNSGAVSPDAARVPIVINGNTPRILVDEPPAVSLNEPATAQQGTDAAIRKMTAPAPEPILPEPVFDPGVPDIRELPVSIRSRLPVLTLSVHIYSSDPGARMANINGQMLREGQKLGNLSIKHITPKGVVLHFQGHDFHLGSVGG
ncbi:general secretion pathway protein GspB [Oceanimonas smirnovii]|uniref:general secretion pathway protein GspB n=1 Tax=Oceanimonas smirnovii TaxID=264574 RepID=UPI003FD3EA3C